MPPQNVMPDNPIATASFPHYFCLQVGNEHATMVHLRGLDLALGSPMAAPYSQMTSRFKTLEEEKSNTIKTSAESHSNTHASNLY